jgi:predicted adenylyl cyclase CyaB
MALVIVEIKARFSKNRQDTVREQLQAEKARHVGNDHQIDTYFSVPHGRLKVREGNIENTLVQYDRPDVPGPKLSRCKVVPIQPGSGLKEALSKALGVLAVVDKVRDIFWLDNVKIHLDQVAGLGHFVEIEVQDPEGRRGEETLRKQCGELMERFGIGPEDLVHSSYSDLILALSLPGGLHPGQPA